MTEIFDLTHWRAELASFQALRGKLQEQADRAAAILADLDRDIGDIQKSIQQAETAQRVRDYILLNGDYAEPPSVSYNFPEGIDRPARQYNTIDPGGPPPRSLSHVPDERPEPYKSDKTLRG